MKKAIAVTLLIVGSMATALPVQAAWEPEAFRDEDTLEIRTVAEGKAAHWFKVWLVVLDGQVYVRLGSRAAGRIESNTTKPFVGIRIAGQEFERVVGEEAPAMVDPVAAAMAEKYWGDFLVRIVSHPLTLRLVPEAATP